MVQTVTIHWAFTSLYVELNTNLDVNNSCIHQADVDARQICAIKKHKNERNQANSLPPG